MNDDLFGTLKWTFRDYWEGTTHFGDSSRYGASLDEKDPPQPAELVPAAPQPPTRRQIEAMAELSELAKTLPPEESRLFTSVLDSAEKRQQQPPSTNVKGDHIAPTEGPSEPTIGLTIDTGRKRTKPSKPQREAWEKFLARGSEVWDEILEQAVDLYNRQRPIRARIWKSTYGDVGLRRCLPEVKTGDDLARLVRPVVCRLKPAGATDLCAEIGIHFAATWHVDGFGAVIRKGQVATVGHINLVYPLMAPREHAFRHPVFGPLARIPDNDLMEVVNQRGKPADVGVSEFVKEKPGGPRPWEGLTRCDPFLEYCLVATNRAEFVHKDRNAGKPRSSIAWEFAGGEFEVRVYAARGEPPSEAQARAFALFRSDEARYVADMVQTVFEMYQEVCQIRRRNWMDRHVDDLIPVLDSPDGLRDRMQMRCIHVHLPDANGQVTLGFQFVCSWDYDGFSALWRDGKAREWGVWKDAEPVG